MQSVSQARRRRAVRRGDSRRQNRCHWVLDMFFGEDRCRVGDPDAARNCHCSAKQSSKPCAPVQKKGTLESKRKRASPDPGFRLTLPLGLQA